MAPVLRAVPIAFAILSAACASQPVAIMASHQERRANGRVPGAARCRGHELQLRSKAIGVGAGTQTKGSISRSACALGIAECETLELRWRGTRA
jgi:hypothetical protein